MSLVRPVQTKHYINWPDLNFEMAHGPTLPYGTGGRRANPWDSPLYVTTTTINVTYKPEEADALRTRPAAAEETDRCQESSRPDEKDGEAIERDE